MSIQIVRSDTVYAGHSEVVVLTIKMPDGQTVRREVEDHGTAVSVLPYDPERRTAILVRQFRAPVFFAARQEETLEAVAGLIETADPAECGRRETWEEAGLKLNALEHVGTAWTMPGVSTERMYLYLAVYREEDRAGPGGGIEDENTDVVELALGDLAARVDGGQLDDMKTLFLVQTLRLRHPELFA
jgi:nudix-type nucleoside diphosphatase (YffH/AdpP family)